MNASLIIRTSAPLLLWAPMIVSLYVLIRGHNEPGGGFIGGLLASGGLLFYTIARGPAETRRMMRIAPVVLCGLGVSFAALSGVPSLIDPAVPYLTHLWWFPDVGFKLPFGTALIFDIGVYLTVIGTVTAIFLALVEEAL